MGSLVRPVRFVASPPVMPLTIAWKSLLWAGGPAMLSRGFTDGESLTSTFPNYLPNEIPNNSQYLPNNSATISFRTESANFNGRPTLVSAGGTYISQEGYFNDYTTWSGTQTLVGILRSGSVAIQYFWGSQATPYGPCDLGTGSTNLALWPSNLESSIAGDTAAHLYVARYTTGSSNNQTAWRDNTDQFTISRSTNLPVRNVQLMSANNSGSRMPANSEFAFFGVYDGDFTADPLYSAFNAWVASHYGITVA